MCLQPMLNIYTLIIIKGVGYILPCTTVWFWLADVSVAGPSGCRNGHSEPFTHPVGVFMNLQTATKHKNIN